MPRRCSLGVGLLRRAGDGHTSVGILMGVAGRQGDPAGRPIGANFDVIARRTGCSACHNEQLHATISLGYISRREGGGDV
jgi:hypothetical protein